MVAMVDVAPGDTAVVARVEGASPLVARRLADLGFVPGTRVTALRKAPLGDPASFRVRGTTICLRRAEARAVLVEPQA
jgi:ferrous iron transport protein A